MLQNINYPQILSHGVHLTEEDIAILKDSHAGVINTPVSEMKISDGMAPLVELIEAGIPVGLGSDGALWNNRNDMFSELKAAAHLSTLRLGAAAMGAKEALNLVTIGGAKVFGLENQIGSLEPGKQADFIVLNIDQPHFVPLLEDNGQDNLASLIAYNASGRDVTDVFVRGSRVVCDGEITTLDRKALQDDVNLRAKQLTARMQRATETKE